ncbi:grpE protein [Carex littledalei]|uniref:GrpE protein homolog n=1 Tax=Carex littledalei TaxID=544730 RepID=A0A833REG4_9POAL|nr:grpE protein [Carex littledalei]
MSTALTSHCTISLGRRPFSSRSNKRINKTLTLASLPTRQSSNFVWLGARLVVSENSRRSLVATVKVADTEPTTRNGGKKTEIDLEDLPSMKSIIESYREAIMTGNDQSVAEMEMIICTVENAKNDLASKLTSMVSEIASGKDKFLRLNADFQNFRKQIEKDQSRLSSDIQLDVVQSLLPIVDSFEKIKEELVLETEKEMNIGTSYQGIYKQFVETLRSLGVSIVETVGKPFDPAVHEAVAREKSDKFKVGIVSAEVQRGFLLKDRLLRPASVKVSNGSGHTQSEPTSDQPTKNSDVAAESEES